MQFYHSEPAYVKFELGLPRGASLGLYGRRNALPTHTNYDMLHIVSGYKNRNKRASSSLVTKEVLQYMEPGHWFVSLYNDDGDPQEATCLITLSRDMTLSCPRGCNNGNGECILGKCHCKSGFGGDDCSESEFSSYYFYLEIDISLSYSFQDNNIFIAPSRCVPSIVQRPWRLHQRSMPMQSRMERS